MVVQELLNQIQELGYKFELVGDNIRFTYTRGDQTPKEAIPILTQFKERKQELVKYLQQQPQKPESKHYEPTQHDLELEKEIGKPDLNPNKYPCVRCGVIAGRYCLGLNKGNRFVWGWQCLRCRPYNEPQRN